MICTTLTQSSYVATSLHYSYVGLHTSFVLWDLDSVNLHSELHLSSSFAVMLYGIALYSIQSRPKASALWLVPADAVLPSDSSVLQPFGQFSIRVGYMPSV